MSQLTVAHLFDTFALLPARQGPHGSPRYRPPGGRDWVGEKLWRISSAEGTAAALIGADDLVTAVRGTFGSPNDRVLGTTAMGVAAGFSRELRFDGEHRLPTPANGAIQPAAEDSRDEAAELLTQGLGFALARDALGGDHWIVVVLGLGRVGAGPSSELLAALTRVRRFLIVCCDPRESSMAHGNASAPQWFDRVSSEKGLAYLGPVGGVELDGLLAVLEALKAIEQPTILHLRLRRDDEAPGRQAFDRPAAPNRAMIPKSTTLPIMRGTRGRFGAPIPDADELSREQRQILAQQLSSTIMAWVESYQKLGKRNLYLWRWCLRGLNLTTLPCVAAGLRDHLCDTKLMAVMLGVLLDDVADQGGDKAFLRELIAIVANQGAASFSRFSRAQRDYAELTRELWHATKRRLEGYPFFSQYEELLDYDHQQVLNTMRYACLVNGRPSLLNMLEHDMYTPHNMQMMSFSTMDLMCSTDFIASELGRLRELIWHAQCMGRIGNLVSTWQREIAERDFTSGVFARALCRGDLTPDDLVSGTPDDLEAKVKSGGHEQYFLKRWQFHRRRVDGFKTRLRSFDVDTLLDGLKQLICMELCSRGHK